MIDLTKITDAVTKVASLASDTAAIRGERDAALAAVVKAQADIDALADKLIAAAGTPAEAVGLAAVAAAVAPVVAPAPTFLPGDPRANQV